VDYFLINGGKRLRGTVEVNGAKNAALPIMAASILCEGEVVLHGVPELADVKAMEVLLNQLGVATSRENGSTLRLKVQDEMNCHADYDLVRRMRASVCVMGPLLAKRHKSQVSMPGGCAIGDRPINLHVQGLQALGADADLIGGDVVLKAKRLRGAELFLGGPFGSTVTGTANILMAATLAEGTTIIESAACEPEVVDLANFLNACGARITGQGSPRMTIEGVKELRGCEYTVIPDRSGNHQRRIAHTQLSAGASAGGRGSAAADRGEHRAGKQRGGCVQCPAVGTDRGDQPALSGVPDGFTGPDDGPAGFGGRQ
jgi:UDP-N-acetylglucosamine 1-carboxyvinyltransferase